MHGSWRVVTATVDALEQQLNALETEGYEIFSVLPVGNPELASNVPREHKSLEQRTTFAIMARRPAG